MRNNSTYWNIDRIMKLIIVLAVTTAVILLLNYLHNALLPFFLACFLAYMLQPLVELNRRILHEKGRVFSSILTLVEVLAVIALVIIIFLPGVSSELNQLGSILHDVETGKRPLPPQISGIISYIHLHFNPNELKDFLSGFHLDTLIDKGTSLLNESFSTIIQILEWALTIIYLLFILIDYPRICRGFKLIVPYKYRAEAIKIMHEVQQSMNHYFRGQGFLSLCAMVLYCIGFSIIKLPLAIPMGIIVGLLYMIPYFQYITVIPVAVICLIYSLGGDISFASLFGKSLCVYLIVQPVCDYLITPHVMGKEMGLNPAIILLALSVWGSLLGIIGMLIALPATSIIMNYYQQYISNPPAEKTTESNSDNKKIIS